MIKLSKLVKYCESIEMNCDVCQHEDSCDNLQKFLDYGYAPPRIVEAVKNDEQF